MGFPQRASQRGDHHFDTDPIHLFADSTRTRITSCTEFLRRGSLHGSWDRSGFYGVLWFATDENYDIQFTCTGNFGKCPCHLFSQWVKTRASPRKLPVAQSTAPSRPRKRTRERTMEDLCRVQGVAEEFTGWKRSDSHDFLSCQYQGTLF